MNLGSVPPDDGSAEGENGARSFLELLRRFGNDAVSFQAVEAEMRHWFEAGSAGALAGGVAYVDTGDAWVAAGGPVSAEARTTETAQAFVRAAHEGGRRACFFATERRDIGGFSSVLLGQQPVWTPSEWPEVVARHRRLREQIRRAGAKGVTVRRVEADELHPGRPLRLRVEALTKAWLASRRMVPMAFLVALEPFQFGPEHRYFVAERAGEVVAFLSAVPIYARRGWLVENLLRIRSAPNGTIEALVDAMMRASTDSDSVTLGLAPLTGPVHPLLRLARALTRPFYDFQGLRAFKQRLRPARWEPVWMQFPASDWAALHVVDALRAFAGGSIVVFGARSVVRHPSGPPWALALPLIPWTLLLATLALAGRADLLAFSRAELLGWAAFDALLAVQLFRSARRPRPSRLMASAAPACLDAVLSIRHLGASGFGTTPIEGVLRVMATLAPTVGAVVLIWAAGQSLVRVRP